VPPDGFLQSAKGYGGKPGFRLAKIDAFTETETVNGDRSAAVLYSVRLRLAKESAGSFEAFSVKNQGNRIVVIVGNRCVFAGVLLSPISTGEFEMSGLTLDSLNAIKPILTEISSK
jgi:preprotein translocase subunit SecD